MLDTSSKNMLIEIRAAEKLRDDHLMSLDSQLKRFHGPSWKGENNWGEMDYDPKNRAFQFIAQGLSYAAYDNPKFTVTSKRGTSQKMVAEAIRHGMNRWAQDTHVEEVAEKVWTDSQFTYGVLVVAQMPSGWTDAGSQEPRMRPQMYRRSPKEFGMDPLAKDVKDARFMFDVWVMDKDDLIKRAEENPDDGWNIDIIKGITSDTGLELLKRPTGDMLNREEIVGYSVYIPEEELDFGAAEEKKYKAKSWREAGFNGVIRTIAVGQSDDINISREEGKDIRDPMPYYGPSSGPYQLIGMYYVPDSAVPLGTLTAVEPQLQELNTHARAYLRSAARRKTIGIVGANDTLLQDAVKNAEDGDVVTANVADLKNNYVQAEFEGPTELQRLTIIDLESNMDNALGSSDAVRGNVTGVGTATENAIAARSSSARVDWTRKKFRRQFAEACKKVAWFLYHDDRVAFPLGEDASQELGMEEPWFHGGTHGEGSGFTFEDLELDIEPMSMSRVDEASKQMNTMQAYSLVTPMFPMMVQFPGAGWEEMVDEIGLAFGLPDYAKTINVQGVIQSGMAMMAAQAGMESEAPQGGEGMTKPKPRLAGDAGLPSSIGGGTPGKGGKMSPAKKPGASGAAKKPAMAGAA